MSTESDKKDKDLIKQAINEWLETKWAMFGRWSAYGLLAMAVGGLGYLFFTTHGFTK